MLHKLENSGLPIYRDDETGKLALEAPLTYKGVAEKTLSQMKGLFADDSGNDPNENIYDVYRGIMDPKDEELFQTYDYQYDITVVKSGNVGMERKKTADTIIPTMKCEPIRYLRYMRFWREPPCSCCSVQITLRIPIMKIWMSVI